MTGFQRRRIIASIGLTALAANACYGYYPPTGADLTGREVRVSLTDSGTVVLAPKVGNGIQLIDGRIVSDTDSHFLLSVMGTQRRDGIENSWKGERIDISRSLTADVAERRFSRARTALFVTVTTIAFLAIKQAFGGAGGANAPGNTQPPPSPQ